MMSMPSFMIDVRWSAASCSKYRVGSTRGATMVPRAKTGKDGDNTSGTSVKTAVKTKTTKKNERTRVDSNAGTSFSASASAARDAFGEYLSGVQATLDAWEKHDNSNPENNGVKFVKSRHTRRGLGKKSEKGSTTVGIASFLVEISQTKLLTKEEEVLLATNVQQQNRVVEARDALAEQTGRKPEDVSIDELAKQMGANDPHDLEILRITANRSKQLLLRHNLRLVVSIAKRYMNRGVALEDLIQEGIGGLIRATHMFDPSRGFKFSTYAHWWIRQSCVRAVNDQSRTIRLPVHVYDALARLRKMGNNFELEHGRRPTHDELAELAEMSTEKIELLETSKAPVLSLDLEQNDISDTSGRWGDTNQTLDTNEHVTYDDDPFDRVQKTELEEDIESVLATLNPRERNVLRMAYGMATDGSAPNGEYSSNEPLTLGDIGARHGLSRERIRQIQSGALDKLRQPVRAMPLSKFVEESLEEK